MARAGSGGVLTASSPDVAARAEARWGPVRLGLQRAAPVAAIALLTSAIPLLEGSARMALAGVALALGIEAALAAAVAVERALARRSATLRTAAVGVAATLGWALAAVQYEYAQGAQRAGLEGGLGAVAGLRLDGGAVTLLAAFAAGTVVACVGRGAWPLVLAALAAAMALGHTLDAATTGASTVRIVFALLFTAAFGAALPMFFRIADEVALALAARRDPDYLGVEASSSRSE